MTDARATAQLARKLQADWVMVDHYGTDAAWEAVQPCRVMAMEDLTTRAHACHLLVNQNLGAQAADYRDLVAPRTTCLMGPEFALLRPEFLNLRDPALARRGEGPVERILISMGGTDLPDATGLVLDLLAGLDLPEGVHLDIVMGPTAPHLDRVRARAAALPCQARVWAGDADIGLPRMTSDDHPLFNTMQSLGDHHIDSVYQSAVDAVEEATGGLHAPGNARSAFADPCRPSLAHRRRRGTVTAWNPFPNMGEKPG